MLQLYVQGTLPSEARADFDRLVKEDAAFCESLVLMISQDLGPVPESTLDAMTARLDDRYERIWKPVAGTPSAPAASAPRVRLPRLPALPRIGLPSLPVEHSVFIGGIVLAALVALIALTNPFQGKGTNAELQAIEGYRYVEPAKAEPVRPAPVVQKAVKRTVAKAAPSRVAADKPAMTERARKAQALVEQAMKSAPDGGEWVAVTAPRTAPLAGNKADLPDLPEFEEAPSYTSVTAMGDTLRLSIPLNQAQAVKIRVTDLKGNLVRDLYSGYWEAGSHTIDWDVKDEAGRAVRSGEYNVLVEAGGQSQTQRVTIK
jgi:hypothetical protein